MSTISEEAILRNRLLIDNRPLKKCLRSLVAENVAGKDVEPQRFLTELSSLETGFQKHQLIDEMNNREVRLYDDAKARIAQEIKSGQEEITVLRKRLREAERIRANKRRYDEIAAKIFELPSREKSIENARKLRAKIEAIKADTQALHVKRELRKSQLAVIIIQMHELQDTINEDREQAEAKAMEEALKDEEIPTLPQEKEEEEEGVLMEEDAMMATM